MLSNNKSLHRTSIIVLLLLVIIPSVAGGIYALLYAFGIVGVFSNGFTTMHATNVLSSSETLYSLLVSIYVAIASIGISIAIAIPMVVVFSKHIANSKKSFFVYLPLAIPAIVSAFISFQVLGKTGILSSAAYQVGFINNLQQFPDLINDKFALGIIASHVLMAVPFFLIFFSNIFIQEKLTHLSSVASSLGSTKVQVFFRIVLPILLKKGATTLLLYFIFVLGSYEIPLILGQQSPQMIAVLIVRKMQRYNLLDIPQGYFLSIIYSLFMVALLFVFFKYKSIHSK